MRSYLNQPREGAVERPKRLDLARPTSEMSDHREELEDYFRTDPPRSAGEAAAASERVTGIRGGLTLVRKILIGMGLKYRNFGLIPAEADDLRRSRDEETRLRIENAERLGRFVRFVHGPYLSYPRRFIRLLDGFRAASNSTYSAVSGKSAFVNSSSIANLIIARKFSARFSNRVASLRRSSNQSMQSSTALRRNAIRSPGN